AIELTSSTAAARYAPLAVLGTLALAAAAMHLLFAAERRRRLGRAFWGALPSNAIREIARKPALFRLPGSNRTVTCLSLAIQDFEVLSLSFRQEPASFTGIMQRLLPPMMEESIFHGGMVERVSGEGFMAVWNAPLDDEAHAMHACEAAIRMSERRAVLASERVSALSVPAQPATPEIGIAIATGEAIAGGYMAQGRESYSVSGACAILASRLAELRPRYGSAILVSEATRDACEKEFAFLEVDCVTIEGFTKPIRLYAMLGDSRMRGSPTFRALTTFHDHIFKSLHARQWPKARALVEQCRKLSGANQTLYDFYLARIRRLEAHPPEADWDGAFRAA
ncbi:MAG: adenylate/guanylate cyclase domain-containing protein, partial [Alphaproteobacteria bacterium]|nr:adenylate/guanylate cyclase domain-containing protein [Alphaproteobacteria bacterium]